MWHVVFTKQAQKDAKKLSSAGLRPKAEQLIEILRENPYKTPPPFEKLLGYLSGAFSRRRGKQGDAHAILRFLYFSVVI